MTRSEVLIQAYKTNTQLTIRLIDGLSHEESLWQPPFPTNCVNWVLGHILVSRNESILLSHGAALWEDAFLNRYDSGSDPVAVGDDSIHHFEDLRKSIIASQEQLTNLLNKLSDKDLEQDYTDERGTRARWLCIRGLHWHETYHVGQLELLRSYILSKRAEKPFSEP
jgi:hypothetical protein